MNDQPPQDEPPAAPRRRRRYAGTHPRRFEERYKELQPDKYPGLVEHVRSRRMTPAGMHVPIMLDEVLARLAPQSGEIVIDCTLGYGGHAEAFARAVRGGRVIGLDVDAGQAERARERLAGLGLAVSVHAVNFAALVKVLAAESVARVDVIFADLGVSSMQIDDPARGFSYKHDGPLDMRMNPRLGHTAADLVARMSADELAAALADLADEESAGAIAGAIVRYRQRRPILRTLELADIVRQAKGLAGRRAHRPTAGQPHLHPAARTFQALRILVNDELSRLRELLRVAPAVLNPGGRIGVLTFHSGEDRLVKQAFRQGELAGEYDAVSDAPLRPTEQEMHDNPRSSAAKFRWARRAGARGKP